MLITLMGILFKGYHIAVNIYLIFVGKDICEKCILLSH